MIIVYLLYLLIFSLFLIIIFFLLRTAIVFVSMLTEVPFLPSGGVYREAIKYLNIEQGDKVLDIGSGDGRVLLFASKQYPDAQFFGIEKNCLLVAYANILRVVLGRKNLKFKCINAHNFNMSGFNKIYMYLLPTFIDDILYSHSSELQKDTLVISLHFPMGYNFSIVNKVIKYPVKYRGKSENIFKWKKE